MSFEFLILKDGLPAFHRTYNGKGIENFNLTAGFFQAVVLFSKRVVGRSLETISMSDFLFYFSMKGNFTFILRVDRTSPITKEQVSLMLEQLAERFFQDFPKATLWGGKMGLFEKFSRFCDEVLQVSPTRKGFPILLRIARKPFFFNSVQQITPISSENEDSLNELVGYLNKYVEQWGQKKFNVLFKQSQLFYLTNTHRIVYIFPFSQNLPNKEFSHFLCYLAEEGDWFTFYQLITVIRKRFQQILPALTDYLVKLEKNPTSSEVKEEKSKVQELLNEWADLNQYIGGMQASILEAFFKSGITSDNLTEQELNNHLNTLLTRVGDDIDKVIFAVLGLHQIFFCGEDRKLVEQALSALIAYYPHPSVVLWTEEPSNCLIVGTRPDLIQKPDKFTVVVNLMNGKVKGGEKNEYCSNLIKETLKFAGNGSISQARIFFQRQVSSLFSLLKSLLEILPLDDESQARQCQAVLKDQTLAKVKLVAQMCEILNPLLAGNVHQYIAKCNIQSIW